MKSHKVEQNIDFLVKMVGLCTKIPNFKIKYLKLWQKVAKTL